MELGEGGGRRWRSGLGVPWLNFEFLCTVHLFTLEFAIKRYVHLVLTTSPGCPVVLLPSLPSPQNPRPQLRQVIAPGAEARAGQDSSGGFAKWGWCEMRTSNASPCPEGESRNHWGGGEGVTALKPPRAQRKAHPNPIPAYSASSFREAKCCFRRYL